MSMLIIVRGCCLLPMATTHCVQRVLPIRACPSGDRYDTLLEMVWDPPSTIAISLPQNWIVTWDPICTVSFCVLLLTMFALFSMASISLERVVSSCIILIASSYPALSCHVSHDWLVTSHNISPISFICLWRSCFLSTSNAYSSGNR